MKIEQAIEYGEFIVQTLPEGTDPKYLNFVKLSVEALKHTQKLRAHEYFGYDRSLVGETES